MTHRFVPDVRVHTGLTRESTGLDYADALTGMAGIALAVCLWLLARRLWARLARKPV